MVEVCITEGEKAIEMAGFKGRSYDRSFSTELMVIME